MRCFSKITKIVICAAAVIVVTAACSCSPASGSSAPEAAAPDDGSAAVTADVFADKPIDGSALNPLSLENAGKIVYASDEDGDYDIYIMDIDGATVKKLTENTVDDTNPRFSPDGRRVLFENERNGELTLMLVDAAGGEEPLALTAFQADDSCADFSPE